MKGATACTEGARELDFSFNSRSREGSDLADLVDLLHDSKVSIHAPVKGATEDAAPSNAPQEVSIHAPVKGATADALSSVGVKVSVSIHAPVKGATLSAGDA